MPDRLAAMMQRQHELQHHLGELPPPTASNGERLDYLRSMVLACISELFEALAETGWKPWTTDDYIDESAAFAELSDAWQFLMNAMFAVAPQGYGPEQIADLLYLTHSHKVAINKDRANAGYDGVTGKCPVCKRAYDDPAVKCGPGVHIIETHMPKVDYVA